MIRFGKQFVCSSPDGSTTHSFVSTMNPHSGLYTFMLERHIGPCRCSFCRKGDPGYKRPFGLRVKPRGNGWNMLHWATPWARWYFRWVRRGNW